MNNFFIILLLLFPFCIMADSYDDALKLDAKGEYDNSKKALNIYFKNNINDINQDGVIEKLIYSSTLFDTVDESLIYLLNYVKFMKYSNSRFLIYKKIAEIYELNGNISKAGIYYEKAAYTNSEYIDYPSILNSIDMLIELGFYDIAITKLIGIEKNLIMGVDKDRCFLMLSRLYRILDMKRTSLEYIEKISDKTQLYDYECYELGILNPDSFENKNTFEFLIGINPYSKQKTPTDYIGNKTVINNNSKIAFNPNNEKEIFFGIYSNKIDAGGIINILEQMEIPWFFDKKDENFNLYIFSDNPDETINIFKDLGITIMENNN